MSAGTAPMPVDAIRVLQDLNELSKAQQSFLNSCGDATWVSDDERRAIRWLLAALVDHRRRVRIAVRLWRTMRPEEPVARSLVDETADLIDENRSFAPFIAQWRTVVVGRAHIERKTFWRSLIELAELNLSDERDDQARRSEWSGSTVAP